VERRNRQQDIPRPLVVDQPPLDRPGDGGADSEARGCRTRQSQRSARLLDQQDESEGGTTLADLREKARKRLGPESGIGEKRSVESVLQVRTK
jgi:hypothetical protein